MNSSIIQKIIMSLFLFTFVQTSVLGSEQKNEEPSTPIQTEVSIDYLPPLGKAATLTCKASSVRDAPGTRVWIALPPETQVLSGELEWKGDLPANKTIQLVASIAFNSVGDKKIDCRAFRPIDENNAWSAWADASPIYLSVGNTQTILGYALIPCEEGDRFADPPPSGPQGLPLSSCLYVGIWQDEENKNHYYSVHQAEHTFVVIEFSLGVNHLNNSPITTYVGTKEDFIFTPLAMENIMDDKKLPLKITFISENKGVLLPLCYACQLPPIKIQRIF